MSTLFPRLQPESQAEIRVRDSAANVLLSANGAVKLGEPNTSCALCIEATILIRRFLQLILVSQLN